MKHETSTALYAYWLAASATPACRRRRSARPSSLRFSPPYSSLIWISPPAFASAICGASIATRYGRDLTRRKLPGPLGRARPRAARARPAGDGVALHRPGRRRAGETVGGGFISFEMLILPLSGGRRRGRGDRLDGAHRRARGDRIGSAPEFVAQSLRSVRFLPAVEGGAIPALRRHRRASLPRGSSGGAPSLRALDGRSRAAAEGR